MRRRSEQGTRDRRQTIFKKVFTIYIIEKMFIKRYIFYDFDKIETRLPFRDLSQHFGIYICWSLHPNVLFIGMGKRSLEMICVIKSKVIQPQPKYKTISFQNLMRKRLLKDIH